MQSVANLIILLYLAVLAYLDIRKRTVPTALLAAGAAAVLLYQVFYIRSDLMTLILGVLPGVFCLGLGRLTREKLGYGDGWLLLILGLFLGITKVISLLLGACLLVLLYALFLLLRRRLTRQESVPFLPFLLLAYTGLLLW